MIAEFRNEHRFLSNFWPSEIMWEDRFWPTVEHAYQAMKTDNPVQRAAIQCLATPGKAKRFGKTITLRADWTREEKLLTMFGLVQQKFFKHKDLREMLLATEDQKIQEGNKWNDTFWGVCDGVGENWMGKILMQVREQAKSL
jgi:ribA/ribD-fused uncharacterized protein